MKRPLALLFVALVLPLAVVATEARPVGACSCVGVSDAEAFAQADTVFVGEVVGYEPPPAPRSDEPARWTFKARQVYKGKVSRTQEVVSEYFGASCGLEIAKTGEFLVFGYTESIGLGPVPGPGQLQANLCGGTRSMSDGPLKPGLATPRALAGRSYALPTDGWKPGDREMEALGGGEFHAVLTPDGACAWLGSGTSSYLWPAGYRVRFDPTRLINAEGRVVAKEGDMLQFGGGYAPAPAGSRCIVDGRDPFHIQSNPVSQ